MDNENLRNEIKSAVEPVMTAFEAFKELPRDLKYFVRKEGFVH